MDWKRVALVGLLVILTHGAAFWAGFVRGVLRMSRTCEEMLLKKKTP